MQQKTVNQLVILVGMSLKNRKNALNLNLIIASKKTTESPLPRPTQSLEFSQCKKISLLLNYFTPVKNTAQTQRIISTFYFCFEWK